MRRRIDLIILLLVLVAGGFAASHAQTVGDWWHSQTYHPTNEITQLASDAGMSPKGQQLFFRFSPELVSEQTLTEHCSTEKLGCTEGQSIYILQSNNAAEYNRNVVTAAHEMLHVAYSRLSAQQQTDLQPAIDETLKDPAAVSVVKELETYPSADYYNEAHSFIGSEIPVKNTNLASYYEQYFTDRAKTIEANKKSP